MNDTNMDPTSPGRRATLHWHVDQDAPRDALTRRQWMVGMATAAVATSAWSRAPGERLKIGFVPKQVNNPYNLLIHNGIAEAMKELGGETIMAGPTVSHALSQVPHLEKMLRDRPDAIILAANDQVALLPLLKQASAIGIKIVAVDADLATDARALFVNQATQEGVGRAQMQLLGQLMDWTGQYAVLSATPTADNQNAWIYWMAQEARRAEYGRMERVAVAYGNDDPQVSTDLTMQLLQNFPRLKGIVAPTAVGIVAAARCLAALQKTRDVRLTGLGTPNDMRTFISNGTVKAFQLWNPKDLGYLAAHAAKSLAAGEMQGKKGDTFAAGKLGSYTVASKGEIVLGSPTTFDRSNIEGFDF